MFGKDKPNKIPHMWIKGPQSGVHYKLEFNYWRLRGQKWVWEHEFPPQSSSLDPKCSSMNFL